MKVGRLGDVANKRTYIFPKTGDSRMHLEKSFQKVRRALSYSCLGVQWSPLFFLFLLREGKTPWRIPTHMTMTERLLLYSLGLKQSPGAVLVEVGSYLGASASFLAAASKHVGGATRVYCVDTWRNDAMTEGPRDTWQEFLKNTERYADWIVPMKGASREIARRFDRRIDVLFLDGDHSYAGCKEDVLSWLPRMKPEGILIMHDYAWAAGVRKVVEELIKPKQPSGGCVLQNTYWTLI
jgi:predicted O-methyltransferase YrrM